MRAKTTTTPPLLPPFCLLRRCQCKGDAPPGVSSLGSATWRNEGGNGSRTKTTTTPPMLPPFCPPRHCQCEGDAPFGRVFPRLSHTTQRGGEQLKNKDDNNTSDAVAIPSAAPLSVRGGRASGHVFPQIINDLHPVLNKSDHLQGSTHHLCESHCTFCLIDLLDQHNH